MKILVIGSGGREHALAWRFSQPENVEMVFVAPGNAGTALEPGMQNVNLDIMDFEAQINFATSEGIDLTVIGPEAPLVAGVVDAFKAAGLCCFGPSQGAAQLEGSKTFTKDFMAKHGIPTAAYESFTDLDKAIQYLRSRGAPIVVKADGLAAGKGVVVASSLDEAEAAVTDMLSGNQFGEAGSRVVIEDFLEGEEASFIVIADGETFKPFSSSQDHKAAYDGDKGPNTGGMGAYSPAPVVTPEVHQRIVDEVIQPVIDGMKSDGHPYTGFLYAGLMIDATGAPSVIEFNCRHGDPETQPIMLRLRSNLAEHCLAAIEGKLDTQVLSFDPRAALAVVMAAGGYPEEYAKGVPISGLPTEESDEVKVFHAGTRAESHQVLTNGGRVLGVTALGETVTEAQRRAYDMIDQISWKDVYCRKDIGYRAVAREAEASRLDE